MYFLTNRKIKSNNEGLVDFDINDNAPSNEVYFCIRESKWKYKEIGSNKFFDQIKETKYKQIMLYIHGYNNLPEYNIFGHVEKLQEYFNKSEKEEIIVIPIIWPCDNDFGMVKDYWDDQRSADMSGYSIERAYEKFCEWRDEQGNDICCKHINILAHSMGNRVMRESLACIRKYSTLNKNARIFRNIFMIAADVVNETLEIGRRGEVISNSARNVVVYYANDDLALGTSKIMNLKNRIASRRLGHTGPEEIKRTRNNIYDFPTGHSYFLPNEDGNNILLEHIGKMLKTGRFSEDKDERAMILRDVKKC